MPIPEGFDLIAANGNIMTSNWCGYVIHERFEVSCVYFNADLGPRTVISGPELDLLGYGYTCVRGKCSVWDVETYQIVGEGRLIDNSKYLLDHLKIPFTRDPVPLPEGPMAVGPGGPLQERPLHEGPSFMSSAWKAGCTVLRSFAGSLLKRSQASAQTR
uniref:Uncharacterized protein n=1 Tax=Arundo donax TaxID=35708 RepID=A0A0A8XPM1_ARUDO